MRREDIQKKVAEFIAHSIQGLEIESPKVDFKAKWYNLKDKLEEAEFIKDTTAIANTIGLDGYIIIGFNDKEKTFTQSTFKEDSGLNDTNELSKIIIKRCSNLFDLAVYEIIVDENKISVIHIPPTLEKPIVIKNHKTKKREEENRILVRKGTNTFPASKYDIEMMFYDRKNITPKFQYDIDLIDVNINKFITSERIGRIRPTAFPGNLLKLNVAFDNYGKRAIALKGVSIWLENEFESIEFEGRTIQLKEGNRSVVNNIFCTIAPNTIIELLFSFEEKNSRKELKLEDYNQLKLGLSFSNGKEILETLKINGA